MIFDNQTMFSDRQALTATAASTHNINLSPIGPGIVRDIGPGQPIPIVIQVVEAFVGATSVAVSVQTDDNEAFTSPKTVVSTAAVAAADLVPGYQFKLDYIPRGTDERHVRLNYTVVGAGTAGRVTAGVVLGGHQTNG